MEDFLVNCDAQCKTCMVDAGDFPISADVGKHRWIVLEKRGVKALTVRVAADYGRWYSESRRSSGSDLYCRGSTNYLLSNLSEQCVGAHDNVWYERQIRSKEGSI